MRVGLEDSIHYDYGKTRLATNRELIERMVRVAEEMQRPVATAAQTRQMLRIA